MVFVSHSCACVKGACVCGLTSSVSRIWRDEASPPCMRSSKPRMNSYAGYANRASPEATSGGSAFRWNARGCEEGVTSRRQVKDNGPVASGHGPAGTDGWGERERQSGTRPPAAPRHRSGLRSSAVPQAEPDPPGHVMTWG